MHEEGRVYTKEHLWLKQTDDGVEVGITDRGIEAVDGLSYVDIDNLTVTVEGRKSVFEIQLPVTSEHSLKERRLEPVEEISEDFPIAYVPFGKIDMDQVMTKEEYDKMED